MRCQSVGSGNHLTKRNALEGRYKIATDTLMPSPPKDCFMSTRKHRSSKLTTDDLGFRTLQPPERRKKKNLWVMMWREALAWA
jgi:hypothetical protein